MELDRFEGVVLALRNAVQEGGLVGVVGAGVSIGATRRSAAGLADWDDAASWAGLLESGTRLAPFLRSLIPGSNSNDAADHL